MVKAGAVVERSKRRAVASSKAFSTTISGTPRARGAGVHAVEITATYGHGKAKQVVRASFTLTVVAATADVRARHR